MSENHQYPQVSSAGSTPGEPLPVTPSLPVIERAVLDYWATDNTFTASIENRPPELPGKPQGSNEFVFYDGPPFANGLPHYGHLLTGYAKDLVARYQTQRGKRVERRFGWDTHGLPAELEAMKQLGMSDKAQIEAMGIANFNAAARASVLQYTEEWRDYVTRQARWVDFDHDYKTLNPGYMESVLWAFQQLYQKGLVYQGYRVLPYCWKDETPLSNHELRMDDDVYQQRQDPALTVGFRLESGELALIWTTTPWTLPANLAIAVHPEVEYVVIAHDGERYLLAKARLSAYAKELGLLDAEGKVLADEAIEARIEQSLSGSELVGRSYTPPFNYFQGRENAHQILAAEYVTTSDGTGMVHQAPAFGEDDKATCDAAGIEAVVPVGSDGRFTTEVPDYAGQLVFEANSQIITDLKAATKDPETAVAAVTPGSTLLRHDTYEHSYPHCWRCRNPLIYRAVSSWFVEVTAIKDRMVELNQQIHWIPENVKDGQFGVWLANARDWSISRNRYWGTPIPVWLSDDPTYPRIDVYGSLAEMEADFGQLPRDAEGNIDLHRPFIDELTRPNPDDPRSPEEGQSTMRRVEDVLDVWFDSGSMPYAQNHYPFEHEAWFESHNPADFIVEYIGQTRGWFYTLHILATALFDRPTFKNVISHGIVLGSDGQKMSKSLQNYPDVSEVLDRDGADAMRWFLMASPILRGGNLIVTEQGIREGVRQVLLPLWNIYSFFTLYANACNSGAGYQASWRTEGYTDTLDRYLMSGTADLVESLTEALDGYDISTACEKLREYLDMLSNWYVRRSRQRFFDEDPEAFDALYTALETVTRLAAPLLPLVTEEIWRGLTGGRSVHLTDWPEAERYPKDPRLVEAMDTTRKIASVASSLRKEAKLRVRLPLQELTAVVPQSLLDAMNSAGATAMFSSILAEELNIKQVRFEALEDAADFGLEQRLVVNARAAGPRLGKNVQQAIKAAKSGDWSIAEDGTVTAGGLELAEGEYQVETQISADQETGSSVALLPEVAGQGGGFVVLNTEVTPELAAEGVARDMIRTIQQARKDAGLQISDRIVTTLDAPQEVVDAVKAHQELVQTETLSNELVFVPGEKETQVTVEAIR